MHNKLQLAELNWQKLPSNSHALARLLGPETSYVEARAMKNAGRITQRQWQWYVMVWVWSAVRLSNVEQAAMKQDKCFAALGFPAVLRRIARVQVLREKLWRHHLSAYFLADKSAVD